MTSNNTAPYISTEEEILSVITDNETKLMIQNDTFTNHTTPYDVPVEIVVVLSMFYGIISMVAVLGNGMVILIVLTSRRMQTVTIFSECKCKRFDIHLDCDCG